MDSPAGMPTDRLRGKDFGTTMTPTSLANKEESQWMSWLSTMSP